MKWFIKCIKNYVNFTGRARRKEYWFFVLFVLLFMIAARLLDIALFGMNGLGLFSSLFSLFIFLPNIAVMVRRLHDTGRSGKIVLWYYIASFVWIVALCITGISALVSIFSGSFDALPVSFLVTLGVGGLVFLVWGILFLVWCCTAGTVGDNKYGPDPKAVEE